MAQSNVAREPSMDEILASIRKIIESNEPGFPGFPANDAGSAEASHSFSSGYADQADSDDIRLTIEDDVLVAEFEAEIGAARITPVERTPAPQSQNTSSSEAAAQPSSPPLSLADVAARVRAASERNTAMLREPSSQAAVTESAGFVSRVLPAKPQEQAVFKEPEAAVQSAPAPAVAVEADVRDAEPEVHAPSAAFAEPVSIEADADMPALVSPSVGQQVARSFEDLAQAVDNSPRRSFDEIAQEMLRPMLQEWLDDNLPTLVERLVREEIERVARGPRR